MPSCHLTYSSARREASASLYRSIGSGTEAEASQLRLSRDYYHSYGPSCVARVLRVDVAINDVNANEGRKGVFRRAMSTIVRRS